MHVHLGPIWAIILYIVGVAVYDLMCVYDENVCDCLMQFQHCLVRMCVYMHIRVQHYGYVTYL